MLGYLPIVSRAAQRPRRLRLESLETRAMLSHPTVTAVNLAGTEWAPGFVSYLESQSFGVDGYAIPAGSNQLQTLPWNNVNQIRITFSEDVVVAAADLSVSGANTVAYAFSDFTYDSSTHTAVWTLTAPLTKDKLMLDLDADGMAPVESVSTGEVLDGAWITCQGAFPSGDGEGGTDFEFCFNALPGDVNAGNSVNVVDVAQVNQKIGLSAGDAGYTIRHDVDGSGAITVGDKSIVQARMGNVLPAANPVGMTDDAPTTSGISAVSVAAGTTDYLMSLPDFFADAETSSDDLTYSVVQNTNSSLFNSLNINSSGELDFSFASGMTGDASLTIRGTDPAGLFADTTFSVHVSYAPFITNFYCISEYMDYWTLTGTVGDNDDEVEGYVIHFGGVFAGYNLTAIADIDGVFTFTVELPGLASGTGTAQTQDPHGVLSNLEEDWIIV